MIQAIQNNPRTYAAEVFGRLTRSARTKRGLTQQNCADALGISRTVFLNIEKGYTESIAFERLIRISAFLDISWDDIKRTL